MFRACGDFKGNVQYLCTSAVYFRDILYKRKLMKLFPVIECLKLCPY